MTLKVLLAISVLSISALTLPHFASAEANHKPDNDKIREKMEKFRSEMKDASGDAFMKRQEKQKEMKAHIQNIGDEKKKKIVERLESKLSSISARREDNLLEAHARLTEVYEKLITKEQQLKDTGEDTATAVAALSEAQKALVQTKQQIEKQNVAPYSIDTSDETKLKKAYKDLMQKMQTDAKADRAMLTNTKETLRKASRALAVIEKLKKGESNGQKPTTTPSI